MMGIYANMNFLSEVNLVHFVTNNKVNCQN